MTRRVPPAGSVFQLTSEPDEPLALVLHVGDPRWYLTYTFLSPLSTATKHRIAAADDPTALQDTVAAVQHAAAIETRNARAPDIRCVDLDTIQATDLGLGGDR